ncbi:VPA1269 family protein [Aureimonas sp. SK2]|uniref:VPA1269 family protein n=1 Tax=Aureimonas sp. SK2 TaxID=3015992 RepID=UPI0024448E77|nr:VPA1269 family protein [Aureimonas sp. SK2]
MANLKTNYLPDDFFSVPDGEREILSSHIAHVAKVDPSTRRKYSRSPDRYGTEILSHERSTGKILQAVRDGRCLLSPLRFTLRYGAPTKDTVEQILRESELGPAAVEELYAAGLISNRGLTPDAIPPFEARVRSLLASLCVSTRGAKTLADVGPENLKDWIGVFRTADGKRWRDDLWDRSRIHYDSCLRHICRALEVIFPGAGFRQISGNLRYGTTAALIDETLGASPPFAAEWIGLFDEWREATPTVDVRYRMFLTAFILWLSTLRDTEEVDDPARFMTRPHNERPFFEFAKRMKGDEEDENVFGEGLLTVVRTAVRFSEFVEARVSEGTRAPVFPIATKRDVRKIETALKRQGKLGTQRHTASLPLPKDLREIAKTILEEGENGWPGSLKMCRPKIDGKNVYCPVYPTLYLMMFTMPLRVAQIKRLDSGEGDEQVFDCETGSWARNTGPLAGYWRRQGKKDTERGYARRFEGFDVTGIFVNTNKTGSPYTLPWQSMYVHRLLRDLRAWQDRNIPIGAPLSPREYLREGDAITESALEPYPDIFPLFRLPAIKDGAATHFRVPTERDTYQFWQWLMLETERRFNLANPGKPISLFEEKESGTSQPSGAKFKPHGVRSDGVTRLIKAGVPLQFISKYVVGHAGLPMTIHYDNTSPADLHEMLEAAELDNQKAEARRIVVEAKAGSVPAMTSFVAAGPLPASTMLSRFDPLARLLFTDMDYGMCPWQQTRCHDGGPQVRKSSSGGKDNSAYAPVEGGPRNCLMCRHFVTGPAWQVPLWIKGTTLLRRLYSETERHKEIKQQIDALEREAVGATPTQLYRLRIDITRLEQAREEIGDGLELLAKALANLYRLLEQIARVQEGGPEGGADDTAIVTQPNSSHVEWVEISEFEQVAFIQRMGRIYPSLYDPESEAASMRFADEICFHSDCAPISMAPLTKSEKSKALERFNALLLQRMEREELLALQDGAMRLTEMPEIDELRSAMARIGAPLERRASPLLEHGAVVSKRLSADG